MRNRLIILGVAIGILTVCPKPAAAQVNPTSVAFFPYETCNAWVTGSGYYDAINVQASCIYPFEWLSASASISVAPDCDNVTGWLYGGYDEESIWATTGGIDLESGVEGSAQTNDECGGEPYSLVCCF